MDYFDPAYFDETYFDTTSGVQPVLTGASRRQRPRRVEPRRDIPPIESVLDSQDDDFLTLFS